MIMSGYNGACRVYCFSTNAFIVSQAKSAPEFHVQERGMQWNLDSRAA